MQTMTMVLVLMQLMIVAQMLEKAVQLVMTMWMLNMSTKVVIQSGCVPALELL